jgi:Ulp1 family protease
MCIDHDTSVAVAQIPYQDNGYDCGVFLLQYVEEVVTRWPSITQKDVDARAVPGFNRDMFTPRQMKV